MYVFLDICMPNYMYNCQNQHVNVFNLKKQQTNCHNQINVLIKIIETKKKLNI